MSNSKKSSGSSRQGGQRRTNDEDTNAIDLVRYEFDPRNPPPLTPEQEARLKALAERTDEDIDFSDIPPLGEEFWKNAIRAPFYYPAVHLDANVIEWFQKQVGDSPGALTMAISRVLLDYIRTEKKKLTKKAG